MIRSNGLFSNIRFSIRKEETAFFITVIIFVDQRTVTELLHVAVSDPVLGVGLAAAADDP